MFYWFRSTVEQNIKTGAVHTILTAINLDRILLLSNWIGPKYLIILMVLFKFSLVVAVIIASNQNCLVVTDVIVNRTDGLEIH
jgi:hypothetical protein